MRLARYIYRDCWFIGLLMNKLYFFSELCRFVHLFNRHQLVVRLLLENCSRARIVLFSNSINITLNIKMILFFFFTTGRYNGLLGLLLANSYGIVSHVLA